MCGTLQATGGLIPCGLMTSCCDHLVIYIAAFHFLLLTEGPLVLAYDMKEETSCAVEWVLKNFCYPGRQKFFALIADMRNSYSHPP